MKPSAIGLSCTAVDGATSPEQAAGDDADENPEVEPACESAHERARER